MASGSGLSQRRQLLVDVLNWTNEQVEQRKTSRAVISVVSVLKRWFWKIAKRQAEAVPACEQSDAWNYRLGVDIDYYLSK